MIGLCSPFYYQPDISKETFMSEEKLKKFAIELFYAGVLLSKELISKEEYIIIKKQLEAKYK